MFGECIGLWLLRIYMKPDVWRIYWTVVTKINMKPDVWRMYWTVVTKDKHEARCLENVLGCGY